MESSITAIDARQAEKVLWPGNVGLQAHFVGAFMCLGMAIPQYHAFGLPVGFAYIYVEELFFAFLLLISVMNLFLTGRFSRKGFKFLFLGTILIGFGLVRALQMHNDFVDILRDLRIPFCYLAFIPLIVNLRLTLDEVRYVVKAACVGIAVFFLLDVVSLATNSLLMSYRNPKMVAGLGSRLVYGNEIIPVFLVPLMIWGFRRKVFSGAATLYVILMAIMLTFIAYKRVLLGLWVIALVLTGTLGLSLRRKIKFVALLGLCGALALPFFLQTQLAGRILPLFSGEEVEGSYQVRMFSYATNALKVLEHPWAGHGLGARMIVALKGVHGQGEEHTFVDNSYITVLYKVGVVGFLLWLAWLYLFFTNLEAERGIVLIYALMWALMAIFSAFISNTVRTVAYLMFIMLFIRDISRHLREQAQQREAA